MILDKLLELASAATPGPWITQGTMVHGPDRGGIDIGGLVADFVDEPDAAYIAAASPEVVVALVRVAQAAQALAAQSEPDIAYEGEGFVDYLVPFDAMDALRAALAEVTR